MTSGQNTAPSVVVSVTTLDFIRGVAAVMVVLNHCRGAWQAGGRAMLTAGHTTLWDYAGIAFNQVTSFGIEFVILFFVISGFSMAHSLRYSNNTSRFYLKRVIRIWPPYLLAVSAAFLVAILIFGKADYPPDRLLNAAFYIRTSSPLTPQFWSLSYEVVFYIFCPFIIANRRSVILLFCFAAISTLYTLIFHGAMLNPYHQFALDFLGNELLYFASGAMIYYFSDSIPKMRPAVLMILILSCMVPCWLINVYLGGTNAYSNMLVIVASALAIVNLPPNLARNKWLNIGYCSYSIYLFHYIFVALISQALLRYYHLHQNQMTSYYMWMLGFPPVLAASMATYFLAERKSNDWVRSIRRRTEPPAVSGP